MSKLDYKKNNVNYIKMILINNRNLNRKYVIGGSGFVDSALKFLVKMFTSQRAKELASTAAKEIGKSALDATKLLLWMPVNNLLTKL